MQSFALQAAGKKLMKNSILSLAVLLVLAGVVTAAPDAKGLGDPGQLKGLVIETGRGADGFTLAGRDAWQQLVVTGRYSSGQERDLTGSVSYEAAPAGIVAIDTTGLVTPLKEGKATITARSAGVSATIPVTVTHLEQDLPINFANEVVPIFTKFGCNAGGCHGRASGQNGFKLSLLGFEPEEDYEYLVKEARGRRIFPAAPDHSLLLMKATGQVPHGGGKKIDRDSPFYRVLRRWIEQGTPFGQKTDPLVTRIEVLPKERLLDRKNTQQLTVVAHFSDGSTRDVTRMTQFESNNTDLAEVSGTGLVNTKELTGSAAIMTRFQSHVDVFRATVPLGVAVTNLPPKRNFIDELVFQRLVKLGLPPSELADDGTFLRRVTIDLAGRLPTHEEAEQFLADQDPGKYEKLIDRLLASEDYGYYFANKWGAILRNRRRAPNDDPKPTVAFHTWIRESLQQNKPYDQFVREILTVTGEEVKDPPVVWYRENKEREAQLEDAAQLFLGQRIQCARCHHHPFEKWSQQDYYGFAAFFAQVVVKEPPPPKAQKGQKGPLPRPPATVEHKAGVAKAVNPRTNKAVLPTGLGGKELQIPPTDDPRQKLVDWMVEKDNPFFAAALVNRYWKHFFGRGLVDPEDDLRVTNPASNPELLDALTRHFVEHRYDLKDLCKTICLSSVYRLSAVPNEYNADDRQNHSRFVPKRLNAEVLLDAIDDVTLVKTQYAGVPAGTRAVQLPDNQVNSYFLSVFGRPDASSACECERGNDASLAQALHMFNSTEMMTKIAGTRAKQLASDKRPHEERLRDLYLVALSRPPSREEIDALLAYIDKKQNPQLAYEDIIWTMINKKEFLFNH
jgi:hypothetical protein